MNEKEYVKMLREAHDIIYGFAIAKTPEQARAEQWLLDNALVGRRSVTDPADVKFTAGEGGAT